jgi:Zn-dependent alcohol dehydrogenase
MAARIEKNVVSGVFRVEAAFEKMHKGDVLRSVVVF